MDILNPQIPKWDEIIALTTSAMSSMPAIKVSGWDVCLTGSNTVEIIEANHAPDIDVMQSTVKKGLRKEVERLYGSKVV